MKIALLISYYFTKKIDLCLPWTQRFGETFAHENKNWEMSLNTPANYQNTSTKDNK